MDIWDWLKHEQHISTTRLGLFLTFEGILASAAGVVYSIESPSPWIVIFCLSALAMAIGIFWFLESIAGFWNIQILYEQLKTTDNQFCTIANNIRTNRPFWWKRNYYISISLPILVMIAWGVLSFICAVELGAIIQYVVYVLPGAFVIIVIIAITKIHRFNKTSTPENKKANSKSPQ